LIAIEPSYANGLKASYRLDVAKSERPGENLLGKPQAPKNIRLGSY